MKKFIRYIAVGLVACSLIFTYSACSDKKTAEDATSEEVSVQTGSESYQAYMELLKRFDKWMDTYVNIIKNYESNPIYYMTKYYDMLSELAEWEAKFVNINESDMTESETMQIISEYYRIIGKTMEN